MKAIIEKKEQEVIFEYMPLDKPLLVYNMTEEEKNALKVELSKSGDKRVKEYFEYMRCEPEDVGDVVFEIAYGPKAILIDDTKK